MKKNNVTKLVALSVISSQMAMASSVNVSTFTPASNPAYTYSEDSLMSSNWGAKGKGRPFFGAHYSMINDPLVELNEAHSRRRATLVESINSLNLTFGYGISQAIQIGAASSMSLVRLPGQTQQFGIGDSRLFSKFRLNSDNAPVAFAIMPEAFVPTGNRDLFLSNDSFGGGLRFIAEHDFGPLQMVGNVGYRYLPNAEFRDLDRRSAIPLSLGILAPVGSRWAINADLRGDISLPFNEYQNPSAAYVGARYRMQDVVFSFGGAIGSLNNYSSADFSVIAGVMVMPQGKSEPVVVTPPPAPIVAAAPAPVVVPQKPRVVFTAKELIISEEIKFEHAKAVLTPSGQNLLDEVAKVLKDNKKSFTLINIEGHTNQLGSHAYNNKLSRERAASVREYLISRGIPASLLGSMGFGKTRPKNLPGLSKEAKLAADRRVEFKVVNDKSKFAFAQKAWEKKDKESAVSGN